MDKDRGPKNTNFPAHDDQQPALAAHYGKEDPDLGPNTPTMRWEQVDQHHPKWENPYGILPDNQSNGAHYGPIPPKNRRHKRAWTPRRK